MKKKRKGKDRLEEGKEGEKEQEFREDLIKEQRPQPAKELEQQKEEPPAKKRRRWFLPFF